MKNNFKSRRRKNENNYYRTKETLINNINVNYIENHRLIFEDALEYSKWASEDCPEYKERDLKRIMVNNIRHEQCDYDKALNKLRKASYKARQDSHVAYHLYKNATLSAIAKQYPYLEDECARQKYRMPMMRIVKPLEE